MLDFRSERLRQRILQGSIHFRKKHNYYTLKTMLGGLSKKADLLKVDAPSYNCLNCDKSSENE
jgi:hypothetical protein